ncbi:hypothetical protein FJZ41_02755 [Candidatus Shapirobacteria bacterium]|nr:hypothetical protein [Candidatus Shapirobacteria bacterium]
MFEKDQGKTIFGHDEKSSETEENPPSVREEYSQTGQALFRDYRHYFESLKPKGEVAYIHVDEIASRVAVFYENLLRVINWKEEQLVRRTAIERKLKRRLITEISGLSLVANLQPAKIAEALVLESIRGGHLPNNQIPQNKIKDVQNILEKYIYILKHLSSAQERGSSDVKLKVQFYNWLLELAACEIEETLAPPYRENALINSMASVMEERIRVKPEGSISEKEKRIQIYIAVHRTLFHLDAPIISYRLLKWQHPEWTNMPASLYPQAAQNILKIRKELGEQLDYRWSGEFFKICEKQDTLWLILGDVLDQFKKKPENITSKLADKETLNQMVTEAYETRYKTLKTRLLRMGLYSSFSVMIANAFSLFIVEVPIAKLLYGGIKPWVMVADVVVPTLIMIGLVSAYRLPGKTNLEKVMEEIHKIIYQQEGEEIYEIRVKKVRKKITTAFIFLLYLLGLAISLWALIWVLRAIKLPPTSIFINTMLAAVMIFGAMVVRQRAKEIAVEDRTTFLEFSIDVLSIPIAKIGQWLATKWKKYNVVSVFFTALIDMPFFAFINFVENWSSFLKERKSEIH